MAGDKDRRALARVAVNGRVRVRPTGSGQTGRVCHVRDANAEGVRLVVEDEAGLDGDADRLEVLTPSGRRRQADVELQVVWCERRDDGRQQLGCRFV